MKQGVQITFWLADDEDADATAEEALEFARREVEMNGKDRRTVEAVVVRRVQ